MHKESRTEFEIDNERYLEKFNIFGLFQHLTEQLVISKPPDPLGMVISILEKPTSRQIITVAELIVILTPPGSNFALKHGTDLAEKLNADFINFHKEIKTEADYHGLANDSTIPPLLDSLVPSIKALDKTRILFGFPKSIKQVHMLRERHIYPDKVVVVNYPLDELVSNLGPKLRRKDFRMHDPEPTAKQMIAEYEGNLAQVREVYRDIIYEVDLSKETIDTRVGVTLTQMLSAFCPTNMGPRRALNILITGPPSKFTRITQHLEDHEFPRE